MMIENLQIPTVACQYEMYDPKTLKPLNDVTAVRLLETGWDRSTFAGKTVLDIGCNTGALSIFAVQNGATSVIAVDVQEPLVDFFSSVVASHELPIKVENLAFSNLSVERHGSDIVLCMEVLHWIVHQGGSLKDAVAKLAAVTRGSLFLETPWDSNEPSIRDRDDFPKESYNIETIFHELSRHFEDVQFRGFMTYFGEMPGSKRVLIEARGKYHASLAARHVEDGRISNISLSKNNKKRSFLVPARSGLKVIKALGPESVFKVLEDKFAKELCEFLASTRFDDFVATPLLLGDRYIQHEADGQSYMLFPFVGKLSDYFPEARIPAPPNNPTGTAAKLALALSRAPANLIEMVRNVTAPLEPVDLNSLPRELRRFFAQKSRGDFISQANRLISAYDRTNEDSLIHHDMQAGNFVVGPDGTDYIVDLDLIRSGPLYTDVFSSAVYNGSGSNDLFLALESVRASGLRDFHHFDVAFSVISCLQWLVFRAGIRPILPNEDIEAFLRGLDSVIEFCGTTK